MRKQIDINQKINRCSVEGCLRMEFSMGLCKRHFKRQQEFGDPRLTRPIGKRKLSQKPKQSCCDCFHLDSISSKLEECQCLHVAVNKEYFAIQHQQEDCMFWKRKADKEKSKEFNQTIHLIVEEIKDGVKIHSSWKNKTKAEEQCLKLNAVYGKTYKILTLPIRSKVSIM